MDYRRENDYKDIVELESAAAKPRRGDIFYADLGQEGVGSEQNGMRPVLIIQNNIGNRFSPTVIVACITSKIFKNQIPTHVQWEQSLMQRSEQSASHEVAVTGQSPRIPSAYGRGSVAAESLILCEQIKTIDKIRLRDKVGELSPALTDKVNRALRLSLEL